MSKCKVQVILPLLVSHKMFSKKTQAHYIGMSVVSAGTSLLVLGQTLILCEPANSILSEVLISKEK